jgi:hypothetical protein
MEPSYIVLGVFIVLVFAFVLYKQRQKDNAYPFGWENDYHNPSSPNYDPVRAEREARQEFRRMWQLDWRNPASMKYDAARYTAFLAAVAANPTSEDALLWKDNPFNPASSRYDPNYGLK